MYCCLYKLCLGIKCEHLHEKGGRTGQRGFCCGGSAGRSQRAQHTIVWIQNPAFIPDPSSRSVNVRGRPFEARAGGLVDRGPWGCPRSQLRSSSPRGRSAAA